MLRKKQPQVTVPAYKHQDLFDYYQQQVAQEHIQADDAQLLVIAELQQLLVNLSHYQHYHQSPFTRKILLNKPQPCRHLYIYGGVGTGKSMLMDLFFEHCPVLKKRRVHFHAFMQEVHARIHSLRQLKEHDVIGALAAEIYQNSELLCFDEFHVADIADAMILGRLLQQLFDSGLVLVVTSNQHPDQLYANGLQRELFLPFIARLKASADILELRTGHDYRLSHLMAFQRRYFFPLNEYADYLIYQSYAKLTNNAPKRPGTLNLLGRSFTITAIHSDIALATFNELCEQPLSAADYLIIAKQFTTLILADIPKLELEQRNAAKRLMTLIDVLYEHKVKLICSADAAINDLYPYQETMPEFNRTLSRMVEMQSEAYLQLAHQPD